MYDVIIIGNGPAGIACALYTKRGGLNTLIISKGKSALEKAGKIQNYYGVNLEITGKELYEQGVKQAENLGIEIIEDEVIGIEFQGEFRITTTNSEYNAKKVVLATGTSRKTPNIKGITEYEGKGVSYCATCDAFFYRNKDVAVLGNGNYAIHEAEVLQPLANSVTILTNGKEMVENRSSGFDVIEKPIREFRGTESIESVEFEDSNIKEIKGVFIAEGTASSTDLARKIGALIDNNNIHVNEDMQTTVPGLYACGDCIGGELQISKAVYDGMKAGLNIIKEIKEERRND